MNYIDLTHLITTSLPVYPGDPMVQIDQAGQLKEDGFADSRVVIGTHVGTHIDAPAHMIKDGKTLADYSLDHFVGTALCVDSWNLPEDISGVDAVFFYTGASDRYHEDSYWANYEVMPKTTLKYLLESSIRMIGVDTGSVDKEDAFPIHKALLSHDILIIENLTNLKEVVGKSFEFAGLPLHVALDGAPCRAIAKL